MKSYSEMIKLDSFEDRFNYLKLKGSVGIETFGYDRYLNQALYRSPEWKRARDKVIIRDKGCDLAHDDHAIYGKVLIHHINPISKEQVLSRDPLVFDPDNLVCVSLDTHNAIHYGDEDLLSKDYVPRTPNDTKLW